MKDRLVELNNTINWKPKSTGIGWELASFIMVADGKEIEKGEIKKLLLFLYSSAHGILKSFVPLRVNEIRILGRDYRTYSWRNVAELGMGRGALETNIVSIRISQFSQSSIYKARAIWDSILGPRAHRPSACQIQLQKYTVT